MRAVAGMFNVHPMNRLAAVRNVGPFPTKRVRGDPPARPYVDLRLPLYFCSDTFKPTVTPWLTTNIKCENRVPPKRLRIRLVGYIAVNKVRSEDLAVILL